MKFSDRRRAAAARYLHTVLVVDDKPRGALEPTTPSEAASPSQRPRAGDAAPAPATDVTTPPEAGDSAHVLESVDLQAAFARVGMVCSVVTPNIEAEGELPKEIVELADEVDVLVLDWSWGGDGGDFCCRILRHLLETGPTRRRLVTIYTGEDDRNAIDTKLSGLAPAPAPSGGRYLWSENGLIVRILRKPRARGDWSDVPTVAEAALPEHLIAAYAEENGGLLANAAMLGLAEVRRASHRILRRFRPELDAPYVVHRAYTVPRQDAEDQVVELLADALGDALRSAVSGLASAGSAPTRSLVAEALEDAAVGEWLDELRIALGPAEPAGFLGEDWRVRLAGGFFGKPPELGAPGEWPIAASNSNAAPAPSPSSGSSKNKPTPQKTAPELRDQVADVTAFLLRISDRGKGRDSQSALAEFIYAADDDGAPRGSLTAGTVVRRCSDDGCEFWVCATPRCDAARVKARQGFLFLRLEDKKNGDARPVALAIVGPDGRPAVRILWINPKSTQLRIATFSPTPGSTRVWAAGGKTDPRGWHYSDTAGCAYTHVGRLRPLFAQDLLQRLASALARVGLTESEFMRLAVERV